MNKLKPYGVFVEYNEFKSLALEGSGRIILECKEGVGWITATNDPNDYFVYQGCVLEFPEDQEGILLQGLSDQLRLEVRRE